MTPSQQQVLVMNNSDDSEVEVISVPSIESQPQVNTTSIHDIDHVSHPNRPPRLQIPSHKTSTPPLSEQTVGALLAFPDSFAGWIGKQTTYSLLPFKSWKPRFMIITNSILWLFKDDELTTNWYRVLLLNHQSKVKIIDRDRRIFQVYGDDVDFKSTETFVFQCHQDQELKIWMRVFKTLLNELKLDHERRTEPTLISASSSSNSLRLSGSSVITRHKSFEQSTRSSDYLSSAPIEEVKTQEKLQSQTSVDIYEFMDKMKHLDDIQQKRSKNIFIQSKKT